MNKLNKVCSFHISKLETDAIKVLKENDMNVSRFLRGELRRLSDLLRSKSENKVEGRGK